MNKNQNLAMSFAVEEQQTRTQQNYRKNKTVCGKMLIEETPKTIYQKCMTV